MRKFVTVVGLLVAVVIAGGFYQGWWKVSTTPKDDRGQSQVSLTVDQGEIKKDLQAAKDKAGGLSAKAQGSSETKSVEGAISRIDADGRALTVTTDQREEVKVQITADTKVQIGAAAGKPDDLKSGDTVTVAYETGKGEQEKRATRVTVNEKK
jgi:multidrug efflux pump subunit AcrB